MSNDFSTLIAAASEGSLPRPQVEAALSVALDQGAPALVLLRGEPGSGKTCLVARQLHERGGLHHFLRQGHTEYSLWRDPHGFLLSIGFQLKAVFGADLFPSNVAIDVEQKLYELDEGSTLTGVRIEKLYAVPWMQTRLRVRQEVAHTAGDVTALHIGELVEEYHSIPPTIFREMALLSPLRRLRQRQPETRVVVWIDALDEEAGTDNGIASVLPQTGELQAIGNLSIVLASRPGPHLQRFIDAGATLIDLDEARFDADRRAFGTAYTRRELTDTAVQAALQAADASAPQLVEALAQRGGDNALYLAQFFAAVRAGELPALLAGGLPQGLDAIHARLAGSLARRAGFADRLAPVLQVLCAARRPLSVEKLACFAGLAADEVQQGLVTLGPLLDATKSGYSLYHRAFQETLVAPEYCGEPWWVSLPEAHDRLSAAYLHGPAAQPEGLDDYGLESLAGHLAAGTPASRLRLLDLPDMSWWRQRREAAGSLWPLLGDLECALEVAQSLPPAKAIPVAARLALLAGRIHDAERSLPSGLFGASVRAGQLQRALDSVSPEMRIDDQVSRLTEIAAALAAAEAGGGSRLSTLCRQVLRQGLELLHRDLDGWKLAALLGACPTDAATEMPDWVAEAGELARNLPADWKRPRALTEVARLQACLDAETGRTWFRAALQDCSDTLRSSRSLEESRLVRHWLAFDPAAAAGLLKQMRFVSDSYSINTALEIGRVLEAQGHSGALANMVVQVASMLLNFGDPYELALAEAALGKAYVEVGDGDAAQAARLHADAARERIGAEGDPDRELQNRPQMAVDALIATAALAIDLGELDAAQRLEQAWAGFASPGLHNSSAADLVVLQRKLEPALLEVYVEQLPALSMRAEARLAALRVLFDSCQPAEQALAMRWYAAAVREAEHAAGHGGPWGYQAYAALTAAPAAQIAAAIAQADVNLPSEARLSARLALWHRVPPDDASAWLKDTLALWAATADNIHYVFELPGLLLGLSAQRASEVLTLPMPQGPADRICLLGVALAALAERQSAGSGRTRFEACLAQIDAVASERIPAAALLAFAAGAWWTIDPPRAGTLWTSALLWLNCSPAFAQDESHRHTWLMILAAAFEAAAPEAALPVYLANPEPPLPPNKIFLVAPGPTVDALSQTGMTQRDRNLSLALARLGLASDDLQPAALRALALVESKSASPATRLRQIDAAIAVTAEVEPDSLRCLLHAKAVRALAEMGAHGRAGEQAGVVLQMVRQALPVFGTQPMAGYAAALGQLAAAALVAGDTARAANLLFEARRLGAEGVDRALAFSCEPLACIDDDAWPNLQREVERAWAE